MKTALTEALRGLHPRRFFLDAWRDIDAQRQDDTASYDYAPLIVLAWGAVCLTLMEYFGGSDSYKRIALAMTDTGHEATVQLGTRLLTHPNRELLIYLYWGAWRVLGYLLLPALSLKLMGLRLRDFGLQLGGLRRYLSFYLLAYLVVLALVVAVSFSPEFTEYYPFYVFAGRSWADFAAWELIYAAQFFSLEFFFRGYWLHACERKMGSAAIFAMLVPYCMIHFGKPWIEALGAIIAGLVLGTLALRTRSIWSGFLIHVAVALSMDAASLIQRGEVPTQLWP